MNSKQGLVLYGRYLNTKEGMAGTYRVDFEKLYYWLP